METVLSEQTCQCDLQWAGAIGVPAGAGWGTRRIAECYNKEWYGAGDRDMVIYDGKDAGSFVRLSLVFLHSFLHCSFSFDFLFFFFFTS